MAHAVFELDNERQDAYPAIQIGRQQVRSVLPEQHKRISMLNQKAVGYPLGLRPQFRQRRRLLVPACIRDD